MKCPFCKYAPPFIDRPADFVIYGTSVCEDHIDTASGEGFGRDLSRLLLESK